MSDLLLTNLILIFFAASLIFYAVLGGADFGAGILELFKGKTRGPAQQKLITTAMGPVWEANHVWLILAVVILFNGFPSAYQQLSISMHIPLTLLLVGVTARGCAFTFRHYDAFKDESQIWYSRLFVGSSVFTSVMLGIIAGGLTAGRIQDNASTFAEGFLWPWLNLFCLANGLFVVALFAMIAAVFLVGEAEDEELKATFRRRALVANVVTVLAGGLVFLASAVDGTPLVRQFFASPVALGCAAVATGLLVPLHLLLRGPWLNTTRALGALQVALVVVGWFAAHFPTLIELEGGGGLSVYEAVAPRATLMQMMIALVVGCALILPSLAWLFYVFKIRRSPSPD